MDLRRIARRALGPALPLLCAACGGETPFEYGEDALLLPATLQEALPLATAQARAAASGPEPYLVRMGGGFTVMDAAGRSRNHSFLFHVRERQSSRRITVHLIHGSPWVDVVTVQDTPPRFDADELALDSDDVVGRALQLAPGYSIPALNDTTLARAYAARLSSVPAWPEPENVTDPGEEVAWRVDFLQLRPLGGSEVWFSAARFYFDPVTADLLGDPEIPNPPELYPFP